MKREIDPGYENKAWWLMVILMGFILLFTILLVNCGVSGGGVMLTKQIAGPDGASGVQGPQGIQGPAGDPGKDGLSCSVEQTTFGAAILCEDGTQANIYNGKDGTSCSVAQTDTGAEVTCGDNTVNIANGTNGNDGKDGADGLSGSSCSAVTMDDNSKYVVCTDGSSFQVFDGKDGANGQDSIIGLVNPCGNQSQYDEIFLKLSTGKMIAVYDDMSINKIHLVELVPGSYITTDNTHCYFRVDGDGNIVDQHN